MTQQLVREQSPPDSMRRIARGSTANLVGAVATALCTFAVTVVITRELPRAGAGVFFSTTSVFLVAISVGQLGTQTALVYFLARARGRSDGAELDAYLRTATRAVIAVGVAIAVGVFVAAQPLAQVLAPGHAREATTYLRVLAFFVPVANLEAALLSATRGLGSMRPNTLIEQIARPVAQLLLVVAVGWTAMNALVGLAWSVAYVPAAVAAWYSWRTMRARIPARRPQPLPATRVSPRQFWSFALPRGLTNIMQMLMQRFDIVLVGALSGAVDAAIYAAATRFIVVGQLGVNALTLATQPQLAQRLGAGDRHGANEVYRISTAWLMLVTWPIYLTLLVFGRTLLVVFGHGYTTGQDVISLIALSMIVSTGLGMVDTVLAMAGHTSWNLGNAALALGVNLGLDFWLIPSHSIVGAAIGWAVAIVVRNAAAVAQVGLAMRYHPFGTAVAVAGAVCLVCYLAVPGLVRLLVGSNAIGLVVGLAAGTACYLVALRALRRPLRLDALTSSLRRRSRT